MKLRVRNNSIRLRLTQSEVKQFKDTGCVEEKVDFGSAGENYLIYVLIASDVSEVTAHMEGGKITVSVPRIKSLEWADSNQVGLENDQNVGDGKTLRILIEKDFACLERRDGEEDDDSFPHPGSISEAG